MKRYLIILALCGSVQAGDRRLYFEALERAEQLEAEQEALEERQEAQLEQLERIEKQQGEILRRQQQAEIETSRARREAEEQRYWEIQRKADQVESDACRSDEELLALAERRRQEVLAQLDFQIKQDEAAKKLRDSSPKPVIIQPPVPLSQMPIEKQIAWQKLINTQKARQADLENQRLEIDAVKRANELQEFRAKQRHEEIRKQEESPSRKRVNALREAGLSEQDIAVCLEDK